MNHHWLKRGVLLGMGIILCLSGKLVKAEENGFYVDESNGGAAVFSFDNGAKQPVSSQRYDKFSWSATNPGTASMPNLGVGIKYIENDQNNPDGGGKRRYVYCLDFAKDSPTGGLLMQYTGWAGRKVAYAMYYGAVYYGFPCRYEPYSTGNWEMDYFVTQMAVHILNGEFTLDAFHKALKKGSASAGEQELAYDRTARIVNGANNPGNYDGFTPDGWLDMGQSTFSLEGYQDKWKQEGDIFSLDGVFHPVFRSYYGFDFCEQLTSYDIQVPEGVRVRAKGNQLYADFDLAVEAKQFQDWKLTGKEIPVTVSASLPRYWGSGIYQYQGGSSNFQRVCFLTWGQAGGISEFSQNVQLHIPKEVRPLTIYKKDAKTGEALAGAVFSLWAYDGTAYSKKLGLFEDRGDGSYCYPQVDYTSTAGGWFLIREDSPPRYYQEIYQMENTSDEENYQIYGGREVRMTAEDFRSDRVSEPFIFRDKKLDPKGELEILKFDHDTGKPLEGAELSVYEWDQNEGGYKGQPIQKLVYAKETEKYHTAAPLEKTEGNAGKFKIRETKMPEGYQCPWEKEVVLTEPGTVTIKLEAPNYPLRRFVIEKKIAAADINWDHGNPVFFYRIAGTDLTGRKHSYQCYTEFRKGEGKADGDYLCMEKEVGGIPAGVYKVEEIAGVLRYILTDAIAGSENVKVSVQPAGLVNGAEKITAQAEADLREQNGCMTFINKKVMHDEYSDNGVKTNHFVLKKE